MTKITDYSSLISFLKIKSISTLHSNKGEMERARKFLIDIFQQLGFETKILNSKSHKAVFAQHTTNKTLPTVLIYGHYDVQPPDPLEKWNSDPFDPVIKNGNIYGRGTTDNKGQLMIHIQAVKKYLQVTKKPKVNFKFIIEGEEEIGSPGISSIVKKHLNLLRCDYLIVSDSQMVSKGQPSIDISLRGIIYTSIEIETGKHDLHSGQFGGVAPNAIQILSNIISKLKDERGNVLIPGYYDDVRKLSKKELSYFNKLGTNFVTIINEGNIYSTGGGEENYSINERRWSRPTLDVNGIWGGFAQEGIKTIIPSKATANISMRLVSNQNPNKIYKTYVKYVNSLVPGGILCKIKNYIDGEAYKAPTDLKVFNTLGEALKFGFGKKPVFTAVGGSIGFVPIIAKELKCPVLLVGFGLPTDNLHAPNEHFSLFNYDKGIKSMVNFYNRLTK